MRLKRFLAMFFAFLLVLLPVLSTANPWNGKVVLQGFWWDYWNNNYPNNWSTYVAELAPRLRDMGIDAVWVPPTAKNKNATGSVGYSPFDHYDLGDKYQGNSTATRFGTKDQYLRSVAVLHANGMDVIQDMVWNHTDGAGSQTSAGGQDPQAWSNKWKNFRYACYATPGTANDSVSYGARQGRFPKNWSNFHPNSAHNTEGDDWTAGYWGPDNCYYSGAYGQSSNSGYNPVQTANYMRDQMRANTVWLKKQTGVDGFRLDAVKHFPHWATKDFVWNAAYNAGWANGGAQMFCVGEYVGSKAELDTWIDNTNNSDGVSDVVGTFDFSLRQALRDMTGASGFYDLGSLPGAQQDRRTRTVPFVNNHDTFRPTVGATGNYTGWNTGNELGGGHIEPTDGRIQAAYAVAMAVDGSPQIFFEDLFDVGATGQRWTHDPKNAAQLPVREWLANLIWCHQKLNFKDGAYQVRWQAQDLLIIERSAKAIIAVSDSWSTWQSATIQTNFGANVQLHDYSGANSSDIWTNGQGQATIWVPPCDGSNLRRGYCVWGPAGISGGFAPAQRATVQEWEMANDLGDSHASSLLQGGALPASSTAMRTVGKIFVESGKFVTLNLFPQDATKRLEIRLYSGSTQVAAVNGTGNLTLTYTPTTTAYFIIKVKNYNSTNPTQKVWVKATYTAAKVIPTGAIASSLDDEVTADQPTTPETTARTTMLKPAHPNPFNPSTNIAFSLRESAPVKLTVYNSVGQRVKTLIDGEMAAGEYQVTFDGAGLASGQYMVQLTTPTGRETQRMTLLK